MKKKLLLMLSVIAALLLVVACSSDKKDKSNTKKASVSLNDSQKIVLPENTMKIDEIADGNFASIAGTWKNDSESELVFDDKGLTSDSWELTSKPEEKDGVIQIDYSEKGKDNDGYKLLFVPAGTEIPKSYFAKDNDGDISDVNRDRLLIVKEPLSAYYEAYYKEAK